MTGSAPDRASRVARIAELRAAIEAIETRGDQPAPRKTSRDLPAEAEAPGAADAEYPQVTHSGQPPEGDDWMDRIPARYRDGENGFDRRLMQELAAVGVRCYTINSLVGTRQRPQAIPVFIDWLTHLEERVPGPESRHRQALRANLVSCLYSAAPSLRGRADVVNLIIDQLTWQPPLPGPAPDIAGYVLKRIATKRDFARIADLIEELPPEVPRGSLIEYMGKVKTPAAREIALRYLDTEWTFFSIRALAAMKATGVRDHVAPYLHDANGMVRTQARKALQRLPE